MKFTRNRHPRQLTGTENKSLFYFLKGVQSQREENTRLAQRKLSKKDAKHLELYLRFPCHHGSSPHRMPPELKVRKRVLWHWYSTSLET